MSDSEFDQFVRNFYQDINARSTNTETIPEDQFTELMLEYLADAGEIDDREICPYISRGMRVDGYAFSNDNESLDLFISKYSGQFRPVSISRTELQKQLKKLRTFFEKARSQNIIDLKVISPAFDLAQSIHKLREKLTHVRLFVLTDFEASVATLEDETIGSLRISHHIWDLKRLYRLFSSGFHSEPIEVDIRDITGEYIPFLPMPEDNPIYSTYLGIIPATTLADLYEKFGPRLLERNVRAFLQMRGSINKGIRETIQTRPEMFLAYNNGISATAVNIEPIKLMDGKIGIGSARDFQIVNGGQTTASIYHTRTKEKMDISKVFVQVKLTVLKNLEDLNTIVPKISEYANSQNKINAADFTSNDPFHITIQNLSRGIWAPAKQGSQFETHWYYERARGQYPDDRGRKIATREKKLFDEQNPKEQRFTKTDLAKYENSWDQLPHIVNLGAEKNYREFIVRYHEAGEFVPDQEYFSLLISKSILFRQTDRIVAKQKYGGYKSQIVAYTVALLSKLTQQRLNLENIWKNQGLSPTLEDTISSLSRVVHAHITSPPGGQNISEWCKKEPCWESLCLKKIHLSDEFIRELVDESALSVRDVRARQKEINDQASGGDHPEESSQIHTSGQQVNSSEQKPVPNQTSALMVEQPLAVGDEGPVSLTPGDTAALADSLKREPSPDLMSTYLVKQPEEVSDESPGSVIVGDMSSPQLSDNHKPLESVVSWGSKGPGDGEFARPTGIAVDNEGNIYVSDYNRHCIQKFTSSGTFVLKWGSKGNGDGQFVYPSDVTVDKAGIVWVVDSFNTRIQRFSRDGKFQGKVGKKGERNGELSLPHGIAADHTGQVYVTDRGNHRIQKYSDYGNFIAKWDCTIDENGTMMDPYSIAVGPQGKIFVVETRNNRILIFSPEGTLITTWGSFGTGDSQFNSPGGIAVDDRGNVWVADTKNNRIQKFTSSGTFLAEYGCPGSGDGQFNGLMDLAPDHAGNLYIVDTNNFRIQKFRQPDWGQVLEPSSENNIPRIENEPEKTEQKPGGFIAQFNTSESTEWQSEYPFGIAAGPDGNIFVTDRSRHLIRKFSPDGTLIIEWGGQGSGDGRFKNPEGIVVDGSGNVLVADTGHNRIQKFTPDGTYIFGWGKSGKKTGQFRYPCDLAIDKSGNVLVADKNNNRIQKFSPDGVFLEYLVIDSKNKKFNYPSGVAVDQLDNIYIADTFNFRILKYSSNWKFITQWGEKGSEDGKFRSPTGITADGEGNVLVVDRSNNRVQKFSSNGAYIETLNGNWAGCGNLDSPQDVTVDDSGNIFVTDPGNRRILKLQIPHAISIRVGPGEDDIDKPENISGKINESVVSLTSEIFRKAGPDINILGESGGNSGEFGNPADVAVDGDGNLLVADTGNNRIQKFNQKGMFICAWGSIGKSGGQFDHPTGVTVDRNGQIWVADTNNHRIQEFTSDGKFILQWGVEGKENAQFDNPSGIAVDGNGNVYVADTWNHRIQIFSQEGRHITTLGGMGMIDGRFRDPLAVAVDMKGSVWVADTGNNRIQKFSPTGEFLAKLGGEEHRDGQFDSPSGITVDEADNIWVTDRYNNRIQKFRSDFTFVEQFGTGGMKKGQFSWPGGIAVDRKGSVWVADTRNDRIQKLTRGTVRSIV